MILVADSEAYTLATSAVITPNTKLKGPVGMRVAVMHNDVLMSWVAGETPLYVWGFGTYVGQETLKPFSNNPKLLLDDGTIVFGYQAWWVNEEAFLEMSKQAKELLFMERQEWNTISQYSLEALQLYRDKCATRSRPVKAGIEARIALLEEAQENVLASVRLVTQTRCKAALDLLPSD